MPLLGAHVDSSGGLHLAFERAAAMGAEAIQVHPTPPGFWGSPKLDEERISKFKEAAAAHGNPPFYFHAVYLINLAGDDPAMRQRSESTLSGYMKAADDLSEFESALAKELGPRVDSLPYLIVFTPSGKRFDIAGADLTLLDKALAAK